MTDNALEGEIMQRPDSDSPGVTINGTPISKHAGVPGSAYEGAERAGRELASWNPRQTSADGALGRNDKIVLDSRGRDILRNSGPMQGASNTHKDSIVGARYRLNSQPLVRVLGAGFDEKWAEEFQKEIEAKFACLAESQDRWLDASRSCRFTEMIRLAVGVFFAGGEVLATAEWMRGALRPCATALQFVDADRLSNPQDVQDTKFLRRGIEKDRFGAPIAAHIRMGHPKDTYPGTDQYTWKRVPFRKPWGRVQVIHIVDHTRPDQTRGVADMVAILKESRMGKQFHDISLQNAIVQASYAAAIESELPRDMALEMIGATEGGLTGASLSYLEAIAAYSRGGRNLEIDGVKIPHLFPGSKLKMLPAASVGNIGQDFEQSLNRNIAAGLGISYEEYTHDLSQTNYSSYRGATNQTARFMHSRKSLVADETANYIFALVMEEWVNNGEIESMPQRAKSNPNFFYEGMNKDALCNASWIGASAGQVDELKETQAALLRVKGGISTFEVECAKLGKDWREVFTQRAREEGLISELGLTFDMAPTKPGTMSGDRSADGDDEDTNNGGKAKPKARAFDDGFGD